VKVVISRQKKRLTNQELCLLNLLIVTNDNEIASVLLEEHEYVVLQLVDVLKLIEEEVLVFV